jgi:glyoxylase-like metal-dependent hydrolase (beta-lactamase superfamily II)
MRITLLAAAAGLLALITNAPAQQLQPLAPAPAFDKIDFNTTNLGRRIYMLQGAGGNVTLALANDGAFLIDDDFTPMYGKLKAAIAKVTNQPVRYLINTHFHRDHTGGNEGFGKDGATIVASENVKTVLAKGSRNGLTGGVVPPYAEIALPKQTYSDKLTLRLPGRAAELTHPENVHTDGDTYIMFPDANLLVAGDLVFFGRYPNIDFAYGGSIDGMIRGVDQLLQLVQDDTTIVPGHGPVGNKAMMRDYRQMLVTARDRIAKLKAAGKSEDEIVAARPNADYDAQFKLDERSTGNFIRVVYRSLKS